MPIIPTNGSSIEEPFWKIREAFDPDYLFHYQPIGQDLKRHNLDRYGDLVEHFAINFSNEGGEVTAELREKAEKKTRSAEIDGLEIDSTLETEITERLNPFHRESVVCRRLKGKAGVPHQLTDVTEIASPADLEEVDYFDLTSLSSELRLLATSVIGYSSGLLDEISGNGDDPEVQAITLDGLDSLLQEAWEPQRSDLTFPYDLTNLHRASAYRADINRVEEPDVVVFGSSLEDYCLYESLCSGKSHVYWMPASLLSPNTNLDQHKDERDLVRLRWRLTNTIKASGPFRGEQSSLISESADSNRLSRVRDQLGESMIITSREAEIEDLISVTDEIDSVLKYRREIFERDNVDHGRVMQFDHGKSVDGVDTRQPRHFEASSLYDHRWITDLEIEDCTLPPVAEFGPQIVDIHQYDSEFVRATRRGFSHVCPHHFYFGKPSIPSPTIHIPRPLSIFQTLFGKVGKQVEPSDKGDCQTQVLRRVGKLSDLSRLLRRPQVRAILDRYATAEDSTPNGTLVYLSRSYLSFEGIHETVEDLSTDTPSIIDELTELGFLRRGLILQCQHCRNADWYDLQKIGQSFRCERFRQTQQIKKPHWKKPEDGPKWYFELDEIVYQYYDNKTHVTTLALGTLQEESDSFLYAPELEVRDDPDESTPNLEIDICAITDGQLVLGEASVSADKGEDDVDTYVDLAKAVNAKTVVFASLEAEWSEHIINYTERRCEGVDVEPLFLKGEDLLQQKP